MTSWSDNSAKIVHCMDKDREISTSPDMEILDKEINSLFVSLHTSRRYYAGKGGGEDINSLIITGPCTL